MSDKIYIGPNAADLDYDEKAAKITRVNLSVDSENIYTAGDDTGRTLEVSCPWGTQAMANSILSRMQAVEYQPYEASDALLDPAAEIGDGVTVGGIYSVIAQSSISLDKQCAANISAPYSDEIDNEYPYKPKEQRKYERQIAYSYSLISKTAEEIRLEVASAEDSIASLKLTVNSITLSVSNDTSSSTISLMRDGVAVTSKTIQFTGMVTFTDLETAGKTTINGSNITTGTITSKYLQLYGNMTVYTNSDLATVGGYIGYTTSANDGSTGIHMGCQSGDVVATANGAKLIYDDVSNQIYITNGAAGIYANGTQYRFEEASFYPAYSTVTLGTTSSRWGQLYTTTSPSVSSDANMKHAIEDLPEKYLTLFDCLIPRRFKLNDGTSDRFHAGFIAQEVEAAMIAAGVDSQEFGGFVKDKGEAGEDIYFLRYEEFIAVLAAKIHTLEARIYELEGTA